MKLLFYTRCTFQTDIKTDMRTNSAGDCGSTVMFYIGELLYSTRSDGVVVYE